MDPLTITLAVVTLATAVKDIVQLAQTIDDSLSKVSRNKDTMRRLSKRIMKIVLDLQAFCDEHMEALERSPSLKSAVVDLHNEMRVVADRLRSMLPRPPENKLLDSKLKSFLAWMRRNKVEEELKLVLEHVRDCYLRFTTFSVLRIEGKLVLTSAPDKPAPSVAEKSSKFLLEISDDSIAAFLGTSTSSPGTMATSFELTRELISDMYLRLQVERIISYLTRLDRNSLIPSSLTWPFMTMKYDFPQDRHVSHSLALGSMLSLEQDLKGAGTRLPASTLQRVTIGISHLIVSMQRLQMIDEAIALALQALQLDLLLTEFNSLMCTLSMITLTHLGGFYRQKNDQKAEGRALFQALEIIRRTNLRPSTEGTSPFFDTRAAIIFCWHADFLLRSRNISGAIMEAEASLKLLEVTFSPEFKMIQDIPENVRNRNEIFLNAALCYGRAARLLSDAFWLSGRKAESIDLSKRSLNVYRTIYSLGFPLAELDIAFASYWLAGNRLCPEISADESREHGQRSIEIYRRYASKFPTLCGSNLYESLQCEVHRLRMEGRDYEARIVGQEAALWRVHVR